MRYLILLLVLVFAIPAYADYNVTIGSGASANGAWSGASPDVWTPSASGATVSATEIQTRLAAGTPVTITTAGGGAENGDIALSASLVWTTNTALTLTALHNIAVNAPIVATGASAGLNLGHGAGADYSLNNGVKITLSGGSASLNIGGQAYTVINSLGVAGDATTTTLQGMKNNLSGRYVLGRDIDASATAGWNAGAAGFEPIGSGWDASTSFTGKFDGWNHTVSGLVIERPGSDWIGVFGSVVTGTVRNVGIAGGSINGGLFVGGLIGYLGSGTVSNTYTTGTVHGNASCSGSGCSTGGLIGTAYGGGVVNSFATGPVSGPAFVGGFVGEMGDPASVNNCYATGSLAGSTGWVGGFLGISALGGSISNSYSTGFVPNAFFSGGLAVSDSYTTNNSYWDTQTSGQATSYGGTGKTTAEMKQQTTFAGWDFTNIWSIVEGQTYPRLRWELAAPVFTTSYTAPSATATGNITASFSGGGAGCGYTVSQFIPVSSVATPPPAGISFPQGLFDFTTGGCTNGATLNFTIAYPQALPAGTVYWKYGPTAGNTSPHWYQLPAVIAGNTATFSITDGGLGDDDLSANGTIVDQGGPGVSGGAASIPTLSEWALLALAGLMGLFGMGAMRRK